MAHASSKEKAPARQPEFKPYIDPRTEVPEFTYKAIILGSLFGVIFGASTVYLAVKAGLTVSASIPIAVLSISVLRLFGRATILENNMVQTIGSAGESVAAGVAFTVPALLFLSDASQGKEYFNYWQIVMLSSVGGILGVLFMVPLRRALIVGEHGVLPYPEGTACADVLVAGEKGGRMAGLVFSGFFLAVIYKALSSIFNLWKEAATVLKTSSTAKLPNATISAEISPEYLGVGYILGPKVGGIMVSGSVIAWLVLIPLLTVLNLNPDAMARQARNLGYREDKISGWLSSNSPEIYYYGYVRLIGAGAVTMAGIITLIKSFPTILSSITGSMASLRGGSKSTETLRTERDIPMYVVILGSLALVGLLAVLPILPGTTMSKALMAVLMVFFGFLFVTVASRIVGIIGSSSSPISAMTIATLLGTCVIFIALGFGGDANQPVALCVGAIVCIAAANAGATSQDLKTGFLVGATPIRQQIGLVIGVVVSTLVIGLTLQQLHLAYIDEGGIGGSKFPAPQATLMATIIKGVMSQNLEWSYLFVGAGLSLTIYLCGVSPLAWAVGVYLPISTTFPIFVGGMLRGFCDWYRGRQEESEVSNGMLFATGLVAGGALTGVFSAVLRVIIWNTTNPETGQLEEVNLLGRLQQIGEGLQQSIASRMDLNYYSLIFYGVMALILVLVAMRKTRSVA